MRERGAYGGQAPEPNACRQQPPAMVAITKEAHERGNKRVNHHEGHAQNAVPEVIDPERRLDLRADREEGIAIDVVQQVHAEQDREAK